MILICCATEKEIEKLKIKFKKNREVIFLITGVGILNSVFTLTNFLCNKEKEDVKLIISAGIGGGFKDSDVNINDICIADSEFMADFGVCFGDSFDYFNYNYGKINISNNYIDQLKSFEKIKYGNFITVNSVTATKEIEKFYFNRFSPICENMEGFGIAFISKKFNIDFLEIRAISNFVCDRENWKIEESIENLNTFLENFLGELIKV